MKRMNFGKSEYKSARDDGSGGPYAKSGQTNFSGERATRKTSCCSPQVNFETKASIPVKNDPGQGQKSGTGCNNGY